MGILLIESSSEKIEFGYAVEQEIIINEKLDINCNADTLTYFLKRSFENNNIKFGEIEFVSLSNGPGSFTGLRIGSAIAKGICFTTGSKLIEISTLDIIAGKYKSKKNIISLVTSNSRLSEFYYCEYSVNDDKVKRISEYKIDCAEKIFKQDFIYLINEDLKIEISPEFKSNLINVSGYSNIPSQVALTLEKILNHEYNDYVTSKPFYMKEFIPKI